jgi:hypothetical protein
LTMPGLPMFGHGQIEGFSEKYGMEYKQAYYNESSDEHLIWRHNKEIFPLMKMRYLFSQVENFELYNFHDNSGEINQNVFTFSNRSGNESALVLYNNSYYETEGSIAFSNPKVISGNGGMKRPHHISEIMNFRPIKEYYYIYTDHRTQLEYLISGKEISEQGFKIHLFGYQYRVCLKFREVYDEEGKYEKLYYLLNGKGVSSIQHALMEMELLPLHSRYENFFSFDTLEKIREYFTFKPEKSKRKRTEEIISLPGKIDKELHLLFEEFNSYIKGKESTEKIEKKYNKDLLKCRDFFQFWITHNKRKNVTKWMKSVNKFLPVNSNLEMKRDYLTLINLILLKQLLNKKSDFNKIKFIFDDLLISKPITNILEKHLNGSSIYLRIELMKILLLFLLNQLLVEIKKETTSISSKKKLNKNEKGSFLSQIKVLLEEDIVHKFIKVNVFEGITYFNKERFEDLIRWIMLFDLIEATSSIKSNKKEKRLNVTEMNREINKSLKTISDDLSLLVKKAETCGYDFIKFKNEIENSRN